MSDVHLTETRFLSGLQCERRLWLDVHAPEEASPAGESRDHILRMEADVLRGARSLYPGGMLVHVRGGDHADAIEQTRALMANESVPAVFEAAFEYQGVQLRIDVLERSGRGHWGIRDVRSSAAVKPEAHIPELAIQRWVVEGCGIQVDSTQLLHIDASFVRGGGDVDWSTFFHRVELLDRISGEVLARVAREVAAMRETLAQADRPPKQPGSFCRRHHLCDYWDTCTSRKDAAWFIDESLASTEHKTRMREASRTGKPWISDTLIHEVASLAVPVWALELGTVGAAIPCFPGIQPYQPIPFQWSLHQLGADRKVRHYGYLADALRDPRPEVARTLVETLGRDDAPVLVYGGSAKQSLKDMAKVVPELAVELEAILGRMVDLRAIVRRHVYHPDFLGSYAFEFVRPALAPGVVYTDLFEVPHGRAAVESFAKIVAGELPASEERRLRQALVAYGERNTLALLVVYRALRNGARLP